MPGHIALAKGEQGISKFGVFIFEDSDYLLRIHDAVSRQFAEGLVKGGAVTSHVIVDQGSLIAGLVKLLVERHQVVNEHHPIFHLRNHRCDFSEKLILVELGTGEH